MDSCCADALAIVLHDIVVIPNAALDRRCAGVLSFESERQMSKSRIVRQPGFGSPNQNSPILGIISQIPRVLK